MDITALLGTTPTLSAQTSTSPEGADASTFAQNLSEATGRQAEAANAAPAATTQKTRPASPQSTPEPEPAQRPEPIQTSEAATAQVVVQDAPQAAIQDPLPLGEAPLTDVPVTEETEPLTDAPTLATELPEPLPTEPAVAAQPTAQPALQPKPAIKVAEQDQAQEAPADPEPVNAATDAPTSGDELDASSDSDTQLQQIRDRMHLIDNAGNLDTSSATPSYVPIVPALPVDVSAPAQTNEVQSPQLTTAVSPNISALIKDAPQTDAQTGGEEIDVAQLQRQAPQTEHANDDAAFSTPTADSPDVTPASDSTAVIWNATLFTAAGDASSTVANSPALTASVGSTQWQSELSQQVLGLHQRGKQQVDLQLHPADLGPLSISLKMDDSGTQAQFVSAHAAVRTAVEQAIPHLREALASQGISLGQTSVSDHSSRQTRDDQAAGQFSSSRQASDQSQNSREHEPESGAEPQPALLPLWGRVDVYT